MSLLFKSILCLYIFPGPFLPFVISFILFRKKLSFRRYLFISGVVSLLFFIICIAIPYHFQGYKLIEEVRIGEGLGWTKYDLMAAFAYFYTFEFPGFLWLFIGLSQVVFGDISKIAIVNIILKICILYFYCMLLFNFNLYHSTINIVLE